MLLWCLLFVVCEMFASIGNLYHYLIMVEGLEYNPNDKVAKEKRHSIQSFRSYNEIKHSIPPAPVLFWEKLTGQKPPKSRAQATNLVEFIDRGGYPFQQVAYKLFVSYQDRFGWTDNDAQNRDNIRTILKNKVHGFDKSGSDLSVVFDLSNPDNAINGVFINTIRSRSAEIWENLASGRLRAGSRVIPVAPILTRDDGTLRCRNVEKDGETFRRVYSRYCGYPISWVFDHVYIYGREKYVPLMEQLDNDKSHLEHRLKSLGLDHGHLHDANFTFEFIEKDWLVEQLSAPNVNINTLPFDQNHRCFNPDIYLEDTSKWEMVTRVIDLDRVRNDDSIY